MRSKDSVFNALVLDNIPYGNGDMDPSSPRCFEACEIIFYLLAPNSVGSV